MQEIEKMQDNITKLSQTLEFLTQIPERYKFLDDELNITNAAQMDMLHEIENKSFNSDESNEEIETLKKIRQHRRIVKDEKAILEPLYAWYMQHSKIQIELFKVQKNMEKIKSSKENWTYTSRVKELKEGNTKNE